MLRASDRLTRPVLNQAVLEALGELLGGLVELGVGKPRKQRL